MVVTNQITQKEIDKPHINLKGYLSIYKLFMNLEMGGAHLYLVPYHAMPYDVMATPWRHCLRDGLETY